MSNIPRERSGLLVKVRDILLGGGRRAVIGGQSGVGKSTMLDAIVGALRSTTDTYVMHSRSSRDGEPARYHGLRDMLSTVDITDFDLPPTQREALSLALGHAEGSEISVDLVHSAVNSILRTMSRKRLVIVAIDDIDFLDDDTHRLLGYVADRPNGGARTASFVATLTSDPALTGSPPTFDLASCAVEDLFSLPPLGRSAFSSVVSGSVRFELDATDLDELFTRTGGNPQWAFELVYQSAPGSTLNNVPLSVEYAARRRIDTLPMATVRCLAALAVLESSTPAELMAILGVTESELALAQESGVVVRAGEKLLPSHRILAGGALDRLDSDQAQALHHGIIERASHAAQRARYLDRATPAGPDEVVASLLFQAGMESRDRGAASTAIHLLRRSVERTASPSGLLIHREWMLAGILFSQGETAGSARILEGINFGDLSATELDRLLPLTLMVLSARDGEAEAGRFLGQLGSALDHDRVRRAIVHGYEAEVAATPAESQRLADGALAVLREAGTARMTRHRAIGTLVAATLDSGLGLDSGLLDEAAELETGLDGVALTDTAEGQRALFAYQVDDLETSRRALEVMGRRAAGDGAVLMAAVFGIHLAAVQVLSGRAEAARSTIAEWESSDAFTSLPPSLVAAKGLILLRQIDESPLRELIAQPHRHGSERSALIISASLAGIAAARRRRWEEAVFELERARSVSLRLGVMEPGRRLWVDFSLARTYVALGRTDDATKIVGTLRALSGRRRPLLDGVASRIDGLIADREGHIAEASALLRQSVGLLTSAGFPSETALSLFELGRHLHGARMRTEATETIDRAADIASAAGDEQLVAMISRAQYSTGSQTIRNLLSDREQIIADSAAEGRTNREIAESHFLSVRTVETQLSSAYRKLGVRSRSELTALLLREHAS